MDGLYDFQELAIEFWKKRAQKYKDELEMATDYMDVLEEREKELKSRVLELEEQISQCQAKNSEPSSSPEK